MKNLKISQKLLLGFGIVLLMLIIAAVVSFINLNTMETQISNYSVYTVPNNNKVWQMRRDMISVQRYLLIALTSNDPAVIEESLATEASEAQRIRTTLTDYLTTTRADMTKVQQFQDNVSTMGPFREEIETLIKQGTADSKAKAFEVFENQYKPILDENAQIMSDIGDFQNQRGDQQAIDAQNAFQLSILLLSIVIAAAIAITIIITILITKAIQMPVKQIQGLSLAIAQGNLDSTISYRSKDELGALADNMRSTTSALKAIIGDVDMLLASMGNGDFTKTSACPEKYAGQFSSILSATTNISQSLTNTLVQINQASNEVSAGAEQVSSGAQALSQGATEQASSVEELSATITEISEKVRGNAEHAASANQVVGKVSSEILTSNQKMQELIQAMTEINESSNQIGKIIKTIEDIAFQTNILALNAAVEAARAGAAGKGFAVVADEVRSLASKSQDAAKNTTTLIQGSIEAVDRGSKLADQAAQSLISVVEGAKTVAERVESISTASNEQASSIAQVSQGVDQISSVVQTNSATAEESAAASEELSGQASMLRALVGRFTLDDSHTADASPAYAAPKARNAEPTYTQAYQGYDKY